MLKRLWEGWKRVGRKIGDFQARLLLGIFYFLILAPFSIPVMFSDPLSIRKARRGWWNRTTPQPDSLDRALRQS